VPGTSPGTRYRFKIDGELAIPDPASHFRPQDAQGPNEVTDHDHVDRRRLERPWKETMFLELHIGTFTSEGTYRAAEAKLDHFVDWHHGDRIHADRRFSWPLELALRWNSAIRAGQHSYDDLKQFIDAAHQRRLMVFSMSFTIMGIISAASPHSVISLGR